MRLNHLRGLYLKRHGIAEIVLDARGKSGIKCVYAFNRHNDRTELVHMENVNYILSLYPFEIVGVEVDEPQETQPPVKQGELAHA